jgi:hypothetical protein
MFAREGQTATLDLSQWLGPLSPAFAALAARGEQHDHGDGSYGVASPPVQDAARGEQHDHGDGNEELMGGPLTTPVAASASAAEIAELRKLFHTLNNQLGVILTYAELLEAKAPDVALRSRATQIVTATLDALGTTKHLRAAVVR